MYCYNLACFKFWIFCSLILICLVVAFSEFILVQVYLASWIYKFMILSTWGSFLAVLQIFVLYQSLFISSWNSHNNNIRHFYIVSQGLKALVISLKIIFCLLFRLNNFYWSIKFTDFFLILHFFILLLSPHTGFVVSVMFFSPINFLLVPL